MLHKCEEIQKKLTETFRNLYGNIPEIFIIIHTAFGLMICGLVNTPD
jgi:hypothetical protein